MTLHIKTDNRKYELEGRMHSCNDIKKAIESGRFKSLEEISEYCTHSSTTIRKAIVNFEHKKLHQIF